MKPSRSEFLYIRGARCHVRRWGPPDAPKVFMVHGRMDMSATFQFVVDALRQDWSVLASDWRGYGLSDWRNDKYWMYDDLADLEALVEHYSPEQPVRLVGHSYGGAVASMYAGTRPNRVETYISIEGFGHRQYALADVPRVLNGWLDNVQQGPRRSVYPDLTALAARLRDANSRLTGPRAQFLAEHFGVQRDDGRVELAADPWRRVRALPPSFPPADFFQALLPRITAPALWIRATDSHYMRDVFAQEGSYSARFTCLRNGTEAVVADAGHNVHHDRPERVAELIERFLLTNAGWHEESLLEPSAVS